MLSTFSGLPRTAWIVFAGTVVNRLGYVVTPFLVFYLGSRGIPTEQTPYVLGALGAGNLIGPVVGGLLADRLGRRPTMLAGLIGTAVAQGLLFAAPNVVTLALAAMFLSAAGSMVGPASGAMLTDAVTAEQRRAAFSLFHWAVNLGTAAAGILGGFLASHGYWLLFALDAVTSLAHALIVVALLPGGRGGAARVTGSGSGTGYGVVYRDPLMRALLPLLGTGLVVYSLTEVCLPLAIRDRGLPATTLGLMATLNAVLVVVLQPVATNVLARLPQIPVYVGASALAATGIALTGVAHDAWSYAGTVVLWSIGEAMVGGIPGAIIAGLAPADARGRYQGSYQWTWGIARFVALGLGTTVYASVGPAAVWWFSAVAGIAAALGVGALAPTIVRRMAATASEAVTTPEAVTSSEPVTGSEPATAPPATTPEPTTAR
ncbi:MULTISPECIES: MFS transporter [Streptosporangium]|uniref:MFS family permease n=1 Tax=Streptosporangium brasiliense TaxID=47480 RepID=A0ABT9R338_9ACTN|nr:MFS transporter [Streptosporangium brasiliense]MDP9863287.1 MFS family permease [Streptosporangium brasiliense]